MRYSMLMAILALGMTLPAMAQVEIKETANQAEPIAAQPALAGAATHPPVAAGLASTDAPMPNTAVSATSAKARKAAGIANEKHRKAVPSRASAPLPIDTVDSEASAESGEARVDRIVFNRVPILVALKAGQERILSFQNPVTMNVPEELQALLQPLDIIGNAIYITAAAPLPRSRVVVQDLVTGQMIPLDLQASKEAAVSRSLDIFTASDAHGKQGARSNRHDDDDEDGEVDNGIDMVMLTRHAAHMLYAPRRLIAPQAGIRQVRVATRPVTGLYRGALLETTPIGAWRSRDLYVTAVKVVNPGKRPVELDLNELRGQWLAATAQHGTVAAAGSDDDTTAIYLVSERPFEESR